MSLIRVSLLALIITGCRAESITQVDMISNDAATVVVELGFDHEALTFMGEEGQSPFEVITEVAGQIDPEKLGVDSSRVQRSLIAEDGIEKVRVEIKEVSLDELESLVTSPGSILGRLELSANQQGFTLIGSTRPLSEAERVRLRTAPADLAEIFDLRFRFFPSGQVLEHNADRVTPEGGLEWNLLPAVLEDRQVVLQASFVAGPGSTTQSASTIPPTSVLLPSGSTPTDDSPWWVVVVPSVVTAAVVVGLIVRSRAKR